MNLLYHIAEQDAWQQAQQTRQYVPAGFAEDGFIHCSFREQVVPVAGRFYGGRMGLVLLEIDPTLLKAEVRLENLEGGGELFPHIYGVLNLEAVRRVMDFSPAADGSFELPQE
jgi:uncharacterized protein (DUF952 family)